ncbi:hypothetical protein [uncultured Tateyamaria sp.]|uniref:O-antigen ligase family protein n=1 Tax=uncultured Tateyamaria sp. TaxID=455651 RepID=UPI0026154626|nr:hypothetical protein [uncultured Tateyamaria sp.]
MIPPVAALLSWPLVVWVAARGREPAFILIFCVLGGYLFLPEQGGIDLPAAGALDKLTIPVLCALLFCSMAQARQTKDITVLTGWLPKQMLVIGLISVLIIGPILTVLTNPDAFFSNGQFRPGLRIYDAGAIILAAIYTILPLLLARKFLAHPKMHRLLLMSFCIASLIYTPLILFELRMSPQLNNMIYGFFPHSWLQHLRGDGYRPVVFMHHGLYLSIFLVAAVIATFGLARLNTGPTRTKFLVTGCMLFVILVFSKSLGALVIAVLLIPLVLFLPKRLQIFAAALIGLIALSYPVARGAHLVPVDWLLAKAMSIDPDRAASLGFRFHFEELLLQRVEERPLFGWGGYGRWFLTDQDTVADGGWIIDMAESGWVGYFSKFGLLGLPIILIWWRARRDGIGMESAIIALALTAGLIDLIPNSGMTPDKWLLAGALWGRLELGRISESEEQTVDAPPLRFGARHPATQAEPNDTGDPVSIYTRQRKRIERRT